MRTVRVETPETATIGGGAFRLLGFRYSRAARGLIGSWSADAIGGDDVAIGDGITVAGFMTGGTVTSVQRKAFRGGARFSLGGTDAGSRLSCSPPASEIPDGGLADTIRYLAVYCGFDSPSISLRADLAINARGMIRGQTCGEAIAFLAQLGGSGVFIDSAGRLVVTPPQTTGTTRDLPVLLESGESLDTDGYATGVTCTLTCRSIAPDPSPDDGSGTLNYWPSASLRETCLSRTFNLPDGSVANVEVCTLEPIGALSKYTLRISGNGIVLEQKTVNEYGTNVRNVVSGGRVNQYWWYGLLSSKISETERRTVGTATYEVTRTSATTRTYDGDQYERLASETVEERDSILDRLPWKIPYRSRTERTYSYGDDMRVTVEARYEYRESDVGAMDLTWKTEQGASQGVREEAVSIPVYQESRPLRAERRTTVVEAGQDGDCLVRITRTTDDDGLAARIELGDALGWNVLAGGIAEKERLLAYLKALPVSATTEVQEHPGSWSIGTNAGGKLVIAGPAVTAEGGGEDSCPYLVLRGEDYLCGVSDYLMPGESGETSGIGGGPGGRPGTVELPELKACSYLTRQGACPLRTVVEGFEASGADAGEYLSVPFVGIAGDGRIWHEVSVCVDDVLTESQATAAAARIAENVLSLRQASRGILKSVTVPLMGGVNPDGYVLSVDHDLGAKTTSITYHPYVASPPESLLLSSVSSVAYGAFAREMVGRAREAPGRVVGMSGNSAVVLIEGRPVSCRTKVQVRAGASVTVYLPPGSTSYGVIREVM